MFIFISGAGMSSNRTHPCISWGGTKILSLSQSLDSFRGLSLPGRPAHTLTYPWPAKIPCQLRSPKDIINPKIIIFWEKITRRRRRHEHGRYGSSSQNWRFPRVRWFFMVWGRLSASQSKEGCIQKILLRVIAKIVFDTAEPLRVCRMIRAR